MLAATMSLVKHCSTKESQPCLENTIFLLYKSVQKQGHPFQGEKETVKEMGGLLSWFW